MNKNTGIIIGAAALIVVVGVVYASMSSKDDVLIDSGSDVMVEKELMEEKENMIKENTPTKDEETSMIDKEDTPMKDEVTSMIDKEDMLVKAGVYEEYASEKLIRAETGDVVLFFSASWCPSCRGLNADIEKNLSTIPEGVSILKVDYDKETELKKKYGVTYQHTLVQVDKDGTMIKKWSGSPTLSNLVSEVE